MKVSFAYHCHYNTISNWAEVDNLPLYNNMMITKETRNLKLILSHIYNKWQKHLLEKKETFISQV